MIEQVVVDGHWLSMVCPWGDLTWSTVWPGGSGIASWSTHACPRRLMRSGLSVQIMVGGVPVWSGQLDEPSTDDGSMNATGLWTRGQAWSALDGSGNATVVPDTAITAAIARGLPWVHTPGGVWSSAVDVDISSGPLTVAGLLDAFCDQSSRRWGVAPDATAYTIPDATTPAWHMWPDSGMANDSSDLATALVGRYLNSATSAYATVIVQDAAGVAARGYLEAPVDLTDRGAMLSASATAILTSMLALGRSAPVWASSIVANDGDITNAGGVPVGLHQVAAGQVLRLHGLINDTLSLGGAMYLDVLIGQTQMSGGQLTITPMGAPARDLETLLTMAAGAVPQ